MYSDDPYLVNHPAIKDDPGLLNFAAIRGEQPINTLVRQVLHIVKEYVAGGGTLDEAISLVTSMMVASQPTETP